MQPARNVEIEARDADPRASSTRPAPPGPDTPVHLCGPEGVRRTVTLAVLLPLSFDAAAMA